MVVMALRSLLNGSSPIRGNVFSNSATLDTGLLGGNEQRTFGGVTYHVQVAVLG